MSCFNSLVDTKYDTSKCLEKLTQNYSDYGRRIKLNAVKMRLNAGSFRI